MYSVLIVDDEPLVRRGIKAFVSFEALHITDVYEACNGEEALQIFRQHKPQLVLADINMPKMNGLDLAKIIKQSDPRVKVALITGYDYFDYAVAALKSGVDDYVLKPVSRKDITELLRKMIEKIEGEAATREVNAVVANIKSTLDSDASDEFGYKEQIKTLLDENMTSPDFSLGVLADEMGLSSGYLSGLFKKLFGASFQDYLIAQRMERGKLLLLTTHLKNYEIAEKIGFEDPNYFSTRFKKEFGQTPSQYKQTHT
jgi:two-component system response regulator YesN